MRGWPLNGNQISCLLLGMLTAGEIEILVGLLSSVTNTRLGLLDIFM
jgi:hypothetical protein